MSPNVAPDVSVRPSQCSYRCIGCSQSGRCCCRTGVVDISVADKCSTNSCCLNKCCSNKSCTNVLQTNVLQTGILQTDVLQTNVVPVHMLQSNSRHSVLHNSGPAVLRSPDPPNMRPWLQMGYTAVHVAAENGYLEDLRMLLEAGATVDCPCKVSRIGRGV